MSSLERFLVKKQERLPQDPKSTEQLKLEPSSELNSAISHLKSIFPSESEENLMLLAIQYQNPKDLEAAVHEILEEGNSINSLSSSWNKVQSRDKKKTDSQKKYNQRQNYEGYQEKKNKRNWNNNYNNYQGYNKKYLPKEQDSKNLEKKTEEKKNEIFTEKLEITEKKSEVFSEKKQEIPEKKSEVFSEKKQEITEKKSEVFSEKKQEITEKKSEVFNIKQDIPKLWSEISVTPPPEKNEETAPDIIPNYSEPKTQEVGIQVNLDYGIPIIVYPYMFQRPK